MGNGLFHQRPLKRQASWIGSCSSGGAGRGQANWTAAVMAARTAGSGEGRATRATPPTPTPTSSAVHAGHSGTFPCLRFGSSSRFDAKMSRLRQITRRVSAGEITSSMYPRSAAMYGLA